jgi:prepilin-type N-terminal cleavage/methylation domain-containing protein
MNQQRERGFTLIELLVVSVIVGILATLVAMTYSGVQAKNRNAARQANINSLQSQLETYYAEKTKYPSLAELVNNQWRQQNLKSEPKFSVKDPQWNDKVKACNDEKGQPILAAGPAVKCYSYQATTTDGAPCTDATVTCTQYTLTATLEGGEKYVKTSLN